MTRTILLASLLLVSLLAGCATQDESTGTGGEGLGSGGTGAANNSTALDNGTMGPPESSAMCLEGAEDRDDTPDTNMTSAT